MPPLTTGLSAQLGNFHPAVLGRLRPALTVITSGPDEGQVERIDIGPSQKFVRRIFSRGRWDMNGRFYGPWWQRIGKGDRARIFINDAPTAELDFQGLHLHLLSLERGVRLESDPYELPVNTVPGTPPELQRKIIKALVLKAINARDSASAFRSFREGWPAGHMAKGLTNAMLTRIAGVFFDTHPHLETAFFADQGIHLMYVDSQITELVLTQAVDRDLPVLGVHDSFIVDYTQADTLLGFMNVATEAVVGTVLPVTQSGAFPFHFPDYVQLEYIQWRQTPRCDGYLRRLGVSQEEGVDRVS